MQIEFMNEALENLDQMQATFPRNSYAWQEVARIMRDLQGLPDRLEPEPAIDQVSRVVKYLERQNDVAFLAYQNGTKGLSATFQLAQAVAIEGRMFDEWISIGDALFIVRKIEDEMALEGALAQMWREGE